LLNTEHVIFTLYANETQTSNFLNISSKQLKDSAHTSTRRNNTSCFIKWEFILQHKPKP